MPEERTCPESSTEVVTLGSLVKRSTMSTSRILADHARVDWPPHCRDEDCVHFGERHQGDHVPTRPLPVGRRVRQYAVGLGRGDALPGGEVSLECEVQHDFTVGSLHFSGDTEHFHVVRVSLTGLELPILTGVPTSVAGPNTRGLPLRGKSWGGPEDCGRGPKCFWRTSYDNGRCPWDCGGGARR